MQPKGYVYALLSDFLPHQETIVSATHDRTTMLKQVCDGYSSCDVESKLEHWTYLPTLTIR